MAIAGLLLSGSVAIARGLAPVAIPMVVLGLLERRLAAGALKSARGWWLNVRLSLLYLGVPTAMSGLTVGLVAAIRHVNGGGLLDLEPPAGAGVWQTVGGCLVFLAVWDFFYYWWHRAQHRSKPLWAMHKLHHMDETLGVSTQMRCHWFEEIGRIPAIVIPMAFFFDLPIHGGVVAIVLTGWSAFIHANLRLGFGRWSAVIAGPQVHRIHHSRLERHHDRNFAAFFPIYDVIFHTYHQPAADEYPSTGVDGEQEVASVWQAFLMPFGDRDTQSRGAKRAQPSEQCAMR